MPGGGLDIHAAGGGGGGAGGASPGIAGLGLGGSGGQQGPLDPALGIGTGAPGNPFGPAGLTTPKAVGRQMGQDAPKGGGMSFGGGVMGAAMGAAASGANLMAPGAGIAAQIGMDMMNRTAGYVAQLGGIAAQGLLETFMLSDTPLSDPTNTVLGRVAIGIAGARPQIPNVAGMGGGKEQVAGGTQAGAAGQPGAPGDPNNPNDPNAKNAGPGGPWVNIENFHNGSGNPSDGKQAGNDIAWRGQQAQAGAAGIRA